MNRAPGAGEHTSHSANCVCVSCLACRSSRPTDPAPSLSAQLEIERSRCDSIVRLDARQRHALHTFTKRWNAARAARGLAPKMANEALTEGLEALIAMIGQE